MKIQRILTRKFETGGRHSLELVVSTEKEDVKKIKILLEAARVMYDTRGEMVTGRRDRGTRLVEKGRRARLCG